MALSLQRRNGIDPSHGLRLWEHYVRSALYSLAGLSVAVIRYEEILAEPDRFEELLRKFLSGAGCRELMDTDQEVLRTVLDPNLRRSRIEGGTRNEHGTMQDHWILPSQQRMLSLLEGIRGIHQAFETPILPNEDRAR